MADAPRLLCLVPARGGSVRLPRKNVLPLAGKPLIHWTLEPALQCRLFADVLVSTDDAEIADVARAAGACVPWLRPAALATATASSADVLRHAVQWYETHRGPIDAVVLLQPTSPFRSVQSLSEAVAQFAEAPGSSLVSVGPAPLHPAWCFTIDGGGMTPWGGDWGWLGKRSQDLPPAYALNGSIYIIPTAAALSGAPVVGPGVRPFVMRSPEESVDIDDGADWQVAEAIARRQLAGGSA